MKELTVRIGKENVSEKLLNESVLYNTLKEDSNDTFDVSEAIINGISNISPHFVVVTKEKLENNKVIVNVWIGSDMSDENDGWAFDSVEEAIEEFPNLEELVFFLDGLKTWLAK